MATVTIDYHTSVRTIEGQESTLEPWRGKVLLVVNTASKCGFTPQLEALEKLWKRHKNEGFVVLGFPCDQFGHQEPGDEAQIADFCSTRYGVTFPLFSKIEVNGPNAHPLFTQLKQGARGLLGTESIKWNFTKFLVDREGKVVERYPPQTTPAAIEGDLQKLL
jgi:glutathione peroxidase